jgi:hypothetical protein
MSEVLPDISDLLLWYYRFWTLAGAQHGVTTSGALISSIGGAVRGAARLAAHRQRAGRPCRTHRRTRLRPVYREVPPSLRAQVLPINTQLDGLRLFL